MSINSLYARKKSEAFEAVLEYKARVTNNFEKKNSKSKGWGISLSEIQRILMSERDIWLWWSSWSWRNCKAFWWRWKFNYVKRETDPPILLSMNV